MKPIVFSILCAYAAACGREHQPSGEPSQPTPRAVSQVQVWGGSEQLRQAKQTVVDTCRGWVSDERCCLALSILMGETNDGQSSQRDAGKDHLDGAANFSAFNVNRAWLKSIGWDEGHSPNLNDQANLACAAKWVLIGMERQGEDKMMDWHRGGECGAADGVSYGCVEYRTAMRAIQAKLLADRSLMTSPHRVAAEIPHV